MTPAPPRTPTPDEMRIAAAWTDVLTRMDLVTAPARAGDWPWALHQARRLALLADRLVRWLATTDLTRVDSDVVLDLVRQLAGPASPTTQAALGAGDEEPLPGYVPTGRLDEPPPVQHPATITRPEQREQVCRWVLRGLDLGDHDERHLQWLVDYLDEPTLRTLLSLIERARMAGQLAVAQRMARHLRGVR